MKKRISFEEAAKAVITNAESILNTVATTNLVFPSYKVNKEDVEKNYREFATAVTRKNLSGYDNVRVEINKRILEISELSAALARVANDVLQNIKILAEEKNKRSVLAASIL